MRAQRRSREEQYQLILECRKEKAQALLEDVLRFYNIFLNCIKNE